MPSTCSTVRSTIGKRGSTDAPGILGSRSLAIVSFVSFLYMRARHTHFEAPLAGAAANVQHSLGPFLLERSQVVPLVE